MYIDHIIVQVWKIVHESRRMEKKAQALVREYYPTRDLGQRLQNFLEEARGQYELITSFYEANSDVLNFWCLEFLMYQTFDVLNFKYTKLLMYRPFNVLNFGWSNFWCMELYFWINEISLFKDCLERMHFHTFTLK